MAFKGSKAVPENDMIKILERRDQYYLEKDPVPNARGDRLFARGPSFLKVKSPGGYEFWVGVTHQKSKRVDPPVNRRSVPWHSCTALRRRRIPARRSVTIHSIRHTFPTA